MTDKDREALQKIREKSYEEWSKLRQKTLAAAQKNKPRTDAAKFRDALTFADLPQPDFIAITVDGDSFSPLWIDLDVINLTWATNGHGHSIVSLYDGKTVSRLIEYAKLAATAAERERAARVCDEISVDKWNLYKGRPPYTGKEAGRAADFTQGQSDGADMCADKIRGGE